MQYMLFICTDSTVNPDDAGEDNIEQWLAETTSRLHGDRLRPPGDATVVRQRGGEVLVSDGPFTETKDWIAGYDIIDCADLDEAIKVASRHPMARRGQIEIRPLWPV